MTTRVKVIGAAAAALLAWLLFRNKSAPAPAAGGSVGISVTKTSSECDTSAPNYNPDTCTASSSDYSTDDSWYSEDGSSTGSQRPAPPSSSLVPGGDGPVTPLLQDPTGLGTKIQQPLLGAITSSRRG